jgi:6-phosphofructokinase 1
MKRFAILTSGGDAPGMNAAIRAATLLGVAKGAEVYGVEQGYAGLLSGTIRPLLPRDVDLILREGGTLLGSARSKAFHEKARRDEARAHLARLGIEGLLVIGGNGSLTGLMHLTDPAENTTGLRGIGLPASIDNDLGLTRLAIGVDTAINTIMEACDKISDTAAAHDRTFIVEVMGRDCGYLAMTSAIASAANAVLFPEMDKTEEQIVDTVVKAVKNVRSRPGRSRRALIIKAEGVKLHVDELKRRVDERLKAELGGPEVETRVTVLGHVVRGGRPSAQDRLIASRLAAAGVQGLLGGLTRAMAAWNPPTSIPAEWILGSKNDPQCALIDLGRVLEETNRMLRGESEHVSWRKKAFAEIETALAL